VTVVVFDIGGVLIENAGYDAFRLLLNRPLSDQEVRTLWLSSPSVIDYECGRIGRGDFGARAVLEFGLELSPEQFLAAFATWPGGFFPGAEDLVRRIRQRHRTGCLSNSNEMHWHAHYEAMFDFFLSSHLVGAVKPSSAIFEVLERTAGVSRGDIVFFDDSQLNVDAACAFGLRGFLAEGFDGLLTALERAGVDFN
jgi:putative hydrolase of the HAD superfamily